MDRLLDFAQANPLLSIAFVGLTLAIVYTEIRGLFRGYKAVNPAQLTELINREDALVLDLRGQPDFEKGHIIGSRHLLPSQIEPEGKLLAKAKENPVVLVCAAGVTASAAAEKLVKAGFKRVSVLDGGITSWQSAGLPLAKGRT
ncbi:rhodanese-like domain-containing protein [Arenimonas daejeonensis]|uniref:rhodanese-like domain-containing protein n=1 Tax=Arenimonas daejeonensis TaxID=370777 RepID=UPI0011BE444E|nr:rhodanese-like domain-containing protein [Arenimonas daejeonensis]